jgi:hypothetical protein
MTGSAFHWSSGQFRPWRLKKENYLEEFAWVTAWIEGKLETVNHRLSTSWTEESYPPAIAGMIDTSSLSEIAV